MIVVGLVATASAGFFYVQALSHAMGAKRWSLVGFCFGPLAWPLFNTHRRLRWLQARGTEAIGFRA